MVFCVQERKYFFLSIYQASNNIVVANTKQIHFLLLSDYHNSCCLITEIVM